MYKYKLLFEYKFLSLAFNVLWFSLLNLPICKSWSPFSPLAVALVLLHYRDHASLDHPHLPHSKLQIAHFDAPLCLRNQLPASFCQSRPNYSASHPSHPTRVSSSFPSSPLSPFITHTVFHPTQTQNLPFSQILPTIHPTPSIGLPSRTQDCSTVFF